MSDVVEFMALPRLEEPVVHGQVDVHDQHVGHRRRPAALAEDLGHGLAVGGPVAVEQEPQRLVDAALPLPRREVEDLQVILDRAAGPAVLQDVVGHPEPAGRKHRVAVAVLLERPRLAHQPVDDVAVLDAVFAPAAEPRQALDPAGAEPDLQRFGPDVDVHPFADEPARHGIRVAADVDRAPRVDPRLDPAGHLQPPRRQRPERGPFLGEPLLTVGVAAGHDLAEEDLILTAVGEIAAASQQEGLVDGLLEPVVALLGVAVLVGLAGLNRLGLDAVMGEQRLIPSRERLRLGVGVDGGGHAVGAVPPGNPSQLPQGVLQALAQALEALGEADRAGLPVGVGEHEVIDQVVERRAGDRDVQLGHMGEVGCGEPPRLMSLCEEHLLGRPLEGTPPFDPPLQATELDIGESPREAPLEIDEKGLGLEPRVEPELIDEFGPDVLERVLPGPPGMGRTSLTGEPVGVAVLACRLLVEARLVGGLGQGVFGLEQRPQPPEQAIGDHPFAPA
jgi:hypothetical protein